MGWIYKGLTFGVYIRMIIEAFLMAVLAVLSEVNQWQVGNADGKVSMGVTGVIGVGLLGFLGTGIVIVWKMGNSRQEEWSKVKEYFSGTKTGEKARIYTVIFLLVRVFSVLIVIFMQDVLYQVKASLFCIVHLLF